MSYQPSCVYCDQRVACWDDACPVRAQRARDRATLNPKPAHTNMSDPKPLTGSERLTLALAGESGFPMVPQDEIRRALAICDRVEALDECNARLLERALRAEKGEADAVELASLNSVHHRDIAKLRAENTTLRVNNRVLEADNADLLDRRRAAESRLATAVGLLRQVHAEQAPTVSLLCAIGDLLDSAQPAAQATQQYRFPEHLRTDEDIAYAAERCKVPAAPTRTECPNPGAHVGFNWSEEPARTEQASGDDLAGALACCRAWEPDARLIGNVRASTLLRLLERTEAEQAVLKAFLRDWSDWSSQEMYGECFHDGWEEQDRDKLFEHIEKLHELARRGLEP